MVNQNLARGIFLALVSAGFALGATRLNVGELTRAGPGLFPLIVSGMLFVLSILMIVRSQLVAAVPLDFQVRNILLIMTALASFVVLARFVHMALAIVAMVFVASLAGTFSWKRSIQVSIALLLIAVAFEKLLGLNLRIV